LLKKSTMDWLDDWLAGLVHASVHTDLIERSRHERFIIARLASTVFALAALPPYLLARSVPTGIECLALLTLASPLVGVCVLSRRGRLGVAQTLVSAALAAFVVSAAAALSAASPLAVLAFLVVPLESLPSGSCRAAIAAAILALLGLPGILALNASGLGAEPGPALATGFAVGVALVFGHAIAVLAHDRRLKTMISSALRSGEAREGLSLQSIDDLVTWHDRAGSVLRATSAAVKLAGVPAPALQGRGLFNRIHVADRPAYLKAISDAAVAREAVVVQFRLRVGEPVEAMIEHSRVLARIGARSVQPMIWVEMRAHRFCAPGEEACTVAVMRDISEHRQRADELDALRRDAERVSQGRAQVLATVGQELRGPLSAVIGCSEMLMGKDSSPATDYARMIHRSGQHMLGVLSSLADFSMIDAGGQDIGPEPLDVAELVQDACRALGPAAGRAGVAVAQDVPPGLPDLRGDRRACQQILFSLISHAVSFAPRGGLVTIQARREADRIALTVRDARTSARATESPPPGHAFRASSFARAAAVDADNGFDLATVRGLAGLQRDRIASTAAPGAVMDVIVSLPIDAGPPLPVTMPARILSYPRSREPAPAAKTPVMNIG
jgi:cell cycle sensor histidine kinase DivJ